MELVRGEDVRVSGGGRLRTYLGTAPGVGKTVAMLAEGRRRAGNGERVMAGWVEWHGRPETGGLYRSKIRCAGCDLRLR